jgi:hypothetical protein
MDHEPEVIRQQMEETRASLADKLETLENQVVSTVQGATTAVTETVEIVKDAVQDTVSTVQETVQKTFDVSGHVDRHPWVMLAGSVAAGFVAGRLLGRAAAGRGGGAERITGYLRSSWPALGPREEQGYRPREEGNGRGRVAGEPDRAGWLAGLGETFGDEIRQLKGMALGALLGVVRDVVSRSAPEQLRPKLAGVMNDITTKLGGEPVRGPVLATEPSDPSAAGAVHEERRPVETGRPYRQGQASVGAFDG